MIGRTHEPSPSPHAAAARSIARGLCRLALASGRPSTDSDSRRAVHRYALYAHDAPLFLQSISVGAKGPAARPARCTDLWRLGDAAYGRAEWPQARWWWKAAHRFEAGALSTVEHLLDHQADKRKTPRQRASALLHLSDLQAQKQQTLLFSDSAERQMQQILRLDADHVPTRLIRAAQHLGREHYDAADTELAAAARAAAQQGLVGFPALGTGTADRADCAQLWQQVAAFWPEHPLMVFTSGLALTNAGRHDEACDVLESLSASTARCPHPLEALGRAHAACGRLAQAEWAYQRAMQRRPAWPVSWLGLGLVQTRRAQYEEAQHSFDVYLLLQCGAAPAQRELGLALAQEGDLAAPRAAQAFRALLDAPDASDDDRFVANAYLAQSLLDAGHYEDALSFFRGAMALAGDGRDGRAVQLGLGRALRALGQISDALQVYGAAHWAKADDPIWPQEAGRMLLEANQPIAALAWLRAWARLQPRNAMALRDLGSCLIHLQRNEQALRVLTRAYALDSQSLRALMLLGIVHHNLLQHELALTCFDRVIAAEPAGHRVAYRERVKIYCRQGRDEQALRSVNEALLWHPEDTELQVIQTVCLVQLGHLDEAVAALWQITASERDCLDAWQLLAALAPYIETDLSAPLACEIASHLFRLLPDDAEVALRLAQQALDLQRIDWAIAAADRLAVLLPDDATALLCRAEAYVRVDRIEEADRSLRRAVEVEPNHAAAWAAYGTCLLCQDRFAEAEVALLRALALAPGHNETAQRLETARRAMGARRHAAC